MSAWRNKISIPLLGEPEVVHMFDQTSTGARNKMPCGPVEGFFWNITSSPTKNPFIFASGV